VVVLGHCWQDHRRQRTGEVFVVFTQRISTGFLEQLRSGQDNLEIRSTVAHSVDGRSDTVNDLGFRMEGSGVRNLPRNELAIIVPLTENLDRQT